MRVPTHLACGLNNGNKLLQTSNVPQKLVLTVTSACSENGSVASRCKTRDKFILEYFA